MTLVKDALKNWERFEIDKREILKYIKIDKLIIDMKKEIHKKNRNNKKKKTDYGGFYIHLKDGNSVWINKSHDY